MDNILKNQVNQIRQNNNDSTNGSKSKSIKPPPLQFKSESNGFFDAFTNGISSLKPPPFQVSSSPIQKKEEEDFGFPTGLLDFDQIDAISNQNDYFPESNESNLPTGLLDFDQIDSKYNYNEFKKNSENSKSNGLSAPIQKKMEDAFGTDFSDVSIYTNSNSAKELDALAYTQGEEIHFAPGQDPYSEKGQEILGHELAHVIQQREGRVDATHQEKGVSVNDNINLETEADDIGIKASRGEKVDMNISKNVNQNKVQKKSNTQKKSNIVQKSKLPTGTTIISINPAGTTLSGCKLVAGMINSEAASQVDWEGRLGGALDNCFSANTLNPIYLQFKEEKGLNMNWEVDIKWEIGAEVPIGELYNSKVKRISGGSSQIGSGISSSSQTSVGGEGGFSGEKGGPEGKISIGNQSGTSTSQSSQISASGTTEVETSENRQAFFAPLIASITVSVEKNNDFSAESFFVGKYLPGYIANKNKQGTRKISIPDGFIEFDKRVR